MSNSLEDIAAAMLMAGRPQDALLAIESTAREPDASHLLLTHHARALKALGRMDECLHVRRLIVARFPDSGIAWHNLAAHLEDLGAAAEAADACRSAFAVGLDAPETWYVYGRALAGQAQLDEAIEAINQALRRRPSYADAFVQKARFVLAITNNIDQAAAVLPAHPAFALSLAELYRDAGQPRRACEIVEKAAIASPRDVGLMQILSGLALELGDDDKALKAAQAAVQAAPTAAVSLLAWATVCVAVGRAEEALTTARALVAAQPTDQTAIALLAAAARLAGAPDYDRLYDYDAFVRGYDIETPAGWPSLDAFLADLNVDLARRHEGATQPREQSLRHGTQTGGDLKTVESPPLKAFFAAIDAPIRNYIKRLGTGDDPLRARNRGAYAIAGAWSNRLRSQGHHVDHIHPRGWLSSAFYVDVPPELTDHASRDGWIQFGRPGVRTPLMLPPHHMVRPTPGKLVLFPSYMWHGTAPFTSDWPRTTIAFDVVPA